MNALRSPYLCCEFCEFVLCTSDVDLSYELAVKVVKTDLYGTAVKKSGSAHCE